MALPPPPTHLPVPDQDRATCLALLEAAFFMAEKPLSLQKIKAGFPLPATSSFSWETLLADWQRDLEQNARGLELEEVAGGYQLRTKKILAPYLQGWAPTPVQKLSAGCLEVLALVAYQQPVLKEAVDQVRGSDSSHLMRQLLEKKLIQISGRSQLPGRPMLYTTTDFFLEVFGFNSLQDLPPLRELEQMVPDSEVSPSSETPAERQLRTLVQEMKEDAAAGPLVYSAEEDEKILATFREKIKAIPSTTPFLEALDQPPTPPELASPAAGSADTKPPPVPPSPLERSPSLETPSPLPI